QQKTTVPIKTWKGLINYGESCGRHRIVRLRSVNGIIAKRVRRFGNTYSALNSTPAAPNLLAQNFKVEVPNRIWVSGITYVPTRKGWLCLAVVVDMYSCMVVGWSMSNQINQQLAIDALTMESANETQSQA
ncbi:MAG TPA: hypothetical protein DCX54_06935, partial [Flavobacteriales bacterium]|nr:hypothetical protein [Flavobacteriales bacterium]